MIAGNLLSVRDVADRLGWSTKVTRARLQALHDKHGGLLFRAEAPPSRDGRSAHTKLWVDPAALKRIMPDRFGAAPTAGDVSALLDRLEEVDRKATRALAEIADFRRRSKAWFTRRTAP